MSSEKPGVNWFDVVTKTVPIIIAIASFLWGIYQFNEGRRRDALGDFYQDVWKMRVATYERIAAAVGEVMKHRRSLSADFNKARGEFEKLYFGGMILVEHQDVERAMVTLKNLLAEYDPGAEGHEDMLERAALQVVQVCREHILAERKRIENSGSY